MKKLFWLIPALLVVIVLANRAYILQVANEGGGFTAKYLCSGVFNSGYDPHQMFEQAVLPASPILHLAEFDVDYARQSVTASILGLGSRTAIFRPRIGCTLVPQHPSPETQLTLTLQAPEHPTDLDHQALTSDNTVGKRPALNAALNHAFAEVDPNGPKQTKAVVVLHQGKLIAEKYAEGIGPDTPLMGWSMSKSVINALIGILVMDGKLALDARAPIPEWAIDERAHITLNHLLRMNSGLQFQEEYNRNSDVARMLTFERCAGCFAATKALTYPVGSHWEYSSGTSNILAKIVFDQTGGNLIENWQFMHERLFYPLGIASAHFEPDASGVPVGSSYLHLSARDWAKLGQLYLQDGVWNGSRLLPEGWVAYSRELTASPPNTRFGAHFWLNPDKAKTGVLENWPSLPDDTFVMKGYQGQRVFIIPSKELVVVRLGITPLPAQPGSDQWIRAIIDALAN